MLMCNIYGVQKGDGTATIARNRQQQLAVEFIVQHLRRGKAVLMEFRERDAQTPAFVF